jgi:hypothetical protein
LLGVVGGGPVGAVMVCAAGARRTAGAFDRYASDVRAASLAVWVGEEETAAAAASSVDGVRDVGLMTVVPAEFVVHDGRVVPAPRNSAVIAASGALLEGVDRMIATEGRLPRPGHG